MRFIALLAAVAAAASCGSSSLTDPTGPGSDAGATMADTTTLPGWAAADCRMFNPTACRIDLAKTSVGVDVNYPNTFFCRLQLLPTQDLSNTAAYAQLAAAWQVSLGNSANDQTVLTAETPHAVLEYALGAQQLYLGRVTFTSRTEQTIDGLIANALGAGVSLYAVPIACPGR